MQNEFPIRYAVDYLMRQGARIHERPAVASADPLQVKREWFAQQLANVVMHKAMRVKA